MNVVQFSPFGLASEETGLLSLFSNYLSSQNHVVKQLRCNGMFSLCDRDGESHWRRTIGSCLGCMAEQQAISRWSGSKIYDLSPFISPEEILSTKRWLVSAQEQDLCTALFEGVPVWDLCRRSFAVRFGTERPDLKHRNQEPAFHRLLVAGARAYIASRNFLRSDESQLLLAASGADYLSAAFLRAAADSGRAAAIFAWDIHARSITIRLLGGEREYQCPIVFEDVTTMRPDPRTWPWELMQIMEQLATFLGISSSQLELPIGKAL